MSYVANVQSSSSGALPEGQAPSVDEMAALKDHYKPHNQELRLLLTKLEKAQGLKSGALELPSAWA